MDYLLTIAAIIAPILAIIALLFNRVSSFRADVQRIREEDPRAPAGMPSSSVLPSSTPETPIDKNVQFTVYRPNTILPQRWYPLVAFAHLSKRRNNAPKDEPDPIQEVQRQAAKILSDQPAKYEATKLDRGFSVPRKGALTFVPLIEGCEFNPPSQTVLWQKTVHKVEFEMMAAAEVDGREVEGQMTVYLGNIILTEVPLHINIDSKFVAPDSEQNVLMPISAEPYRKIFASYSHKDTAIVEDFENYVQSLGDEYLRDVRTLRAGQTWNEELEHMIRDASVFQLFWSSNSMISDYVKQEWEYALSLNRNKFIRPVYWEEPLPKKDPDLPPKALSALHFYKIGGEHAKKEDRGALAATLPAASIEDNLELGGLTPRSDVDSLPNWSMTPVRSTTPWWGVFSPVTLKAAFTVVIFAFVGAPVLLFYLMSAPKGGFIGPVDPSPAPTNGLDPAPSPTIMVIDPTPATGTPTPAVTTPTPMETPQPTSTPTPVPTPSATPTPKPTATPTPTPIPPRGSPISVSVQPAEFGGRITASVYRLTIKNVSDKTITNLVVTERLPEDVGFTEGSPQPSRNGQTLVWQMKELPAQRSTAISVSLVLRRHLSPGESLTLKQRTIITYVDGEGRRRRYQPRE